MTSVILPPKLLIENLFFFVVSLALLLLSVLSTAISPFLGVFLTVAFAVYVIWLNDDRLIAYLFLTYLLFSNVLLTLSSGYFENKLHLSYAQALDFLLLSTIVLIIFLFRNNISQLREIKYVYIIIFVLVVYYYVGLVNNDFRSSTIYFRFFIYPALSYILGAYLFRLNIDDHIVFYMFMVFVIFSFFLLAEFFLTDDYYRLLNVHEYMSIKRSSDYSPYSLVQRNVRKAFNLEFLEGVLLFRPLGLLSHSISTAYVFLAVSVFFWGRLVFVPVCSFFLIILLGVKGAIIAFALTVFIYFVYRYIKIRTGYFLFFSLAFTSGVLTFLGYRIKNPHMVQLVSSVKNIFNNPLGGGLGFGGVNSSAMKVYPFAYGDTAFGVLLSSLGLLGLVVFLIYLFFGFRMFRDFLDTNKVDALCIMLCCVLMNALFQEEAFSPYALGIFMFLLGMRKQEMAKSASANTMKAAS